MAKDKLISLLGEQNNELKELKTSNESLTSLNKKMLKTSNDSLISTKAIVTQLKKANKHSKYETIKIQDRSNKKLAKNLDKGFTGNITRLNKSLNKTLERTSRHSSNVMGKVLTGVGLMGTSLLSMPSLITQGISSSMGMVTGGLSKVFLTFPKMIIQGIKGSMGFITKAILKSQALRGTGNLLGGMLSGAKGGLTSFGSTLGKLAGAVSNIHPAIKALFVAGVGISSYIGYRKIKEARINKSIEESIKKRRKEEKIINMLEKKRLAQAIAKDKKTKIINRSSNNFAGVTKTNNTNEIKERRNNLIKNDVGERVSNEFAVNIGQDNYEKIGREVKELINLFLSKVKTQITINPDSLTPKKISELFSNILKTSKATSDAKKEFKTHKKFLVSSVLKQLGRSRTMLSKLSPQEVVKKTFKTFSNSQGYIDKAKTSFDKYTSRTSKVIDEGTVNLKDKGIKFSSDSKLIQGVDVATHIRVLFSAILELSKEFTSDKHVNYGMSLIVIQDYIDRNKIANKDIKVVKDEALKFIDKITLKKILIEKNILLKKAKSLKNTEAVSKISKSVNVIKNKISNISIKDNANKISKIFNDNSKNMTIDNFRAYSDMPKGGDFEKEYKLHMSILFSRMLRHPEKVGLSIESTLKNFYDIWSEFDNDLSNDSPYFRSQNGRKIFKKYKEFAQELTDKKLGRYKKEDSKINNIKSKTGIVLTGRREAVYGGASAKDEKVGKDVTFSLNKNRQFRQGGGTNITKNKDSSQANRMWDKSKIDNYNMLLGNTKTNVKKSNKTKNKPAYKESNMDIVNDSLDMLDPTRKTYKGKIDNSKDIDSKYNKNITSKKKPVKQEVVKTDSKLITNKTVVNKYNTESVQVIIGSGQGHNGEAII